MEGSTVKVTVVCPDEGCTAGVADTASAASAIVDGVQTAENERAEVRIAVSNITESVPEQDNETLAQGLAANSETFPGLVQGICMDITISVRVGDGEWRTVTETSEPVDIVVGVPKELQSSGREYYLLRAHEGKCVLLPDQDTEPETVTVSTGLFSSYALVYRDTASNQACSVCGICPTLSGLCCFVWAGIVLAAAGAAITVIIIIRKKTERNRNRD